MDTSPEVIEAAGKALNRSNKVFLHVSESYDQHKADRILSVLKSEGFNVSPIERMKIFALLKNNAVKYFFDNDKSKAENICDVIKKEGIIAVTTDVSKEYKVSSSRIEIWLK